MHRVAVDHNNRPGAAAHEDQAQAQRERAARERLVELGAGQLAPRPWQPPPVPPSAVDLIHFSLWWADRAAGAPADVDGSTGDALNREAALAALGLLEAAHAELDQLEAALLFTARGLDLTWSQLAQAIGLNSPQACQQRFDRLARRDRPARGSGS